MSEREDMEACCGHALNWHHKTRGCGYHGYSKEDRCPCLLSFDDALAAHDERVRAESLAPVREVHRRIVTNGAYCAHDQQGWPCQTIATLPPERLAGEAGAE